jgi:hypothetical protein
VFIVHETILELEMCDLVHPLICQCKKHRQLARFPLDVLMVHSSTLAITTDGEHLTGGGFSLGETICFRSLEFIADYFGLLSLSPKGSNSDAIFTGITHSRSPSLWTILEKSIDEFYMTSSGDGSSGLPLPQRHSMGTLPPQLPPRHH